jgi:phosphoinositide-3-kinase, regulatory subunit 4
MYESYDANLAKLQDEFASIMLKFNERSSAIKKALLSDVTQLCMFFGRRRTNDFVLPLVITFLNSKDWDLRLEFFKKIVGISLFVGPISFREFILPTMILAINDTEEFVVDAILKTMISLCNLGLFQKQALIKLTRVITPLLHHPNNWIKYSNYCSIGSGVFCFFKILF